MSLPPLDATIPLSLDNLTAHAVGRLGFLLGGAAVLLDGATPARRGMRELRRSDSGLRDPEPMKPGEAVRPLTGATGSQRQRLMP